uniref:Uncharacterized protein n=1 Tax=Anopheles maculatus TaxID=74869 RepID=A0A182T023_9DIPT
MSDPPIHDLDNDIEENLTAVNIIAPNKLFYEIVEVVDLTEDEFMKEFKTFLNTITDHRLDVDTRRCGTKAKSKLVINTLSVPVVLLCNVRIHQDTFICELFRLNFSNTMIYGMLTTEMYKDDVTIYQLDDGTATVDVYYRPSNNNMLGM